MPKPENLPEWVSKLTDLIHKHWHHSGPCNSINFKTYYDASAKCWQIHVAPAYQEVYGNADDGKVVWTGFMFQAGAFSKASGIWMQDFVLMSKCDDLNPHPKMMFRGKYRGHKVLVHVSQEPDKETDVVEVIDTVHHEVRLKDDTAS